MFRKYAHAHLLAAALGASTAHAAFTYPNCPDVAAGDLKVTPLVTRAANQIAEPMKMAFDLLAGPTEDAKGKVDVYFTERMGKLRKFDSKTNTVITLGTLPLDVDQANSSDGLLGIALDPAFKSNHRLYLYYSYISSSEKAWRVSRFTLNPAHTQLDLASETVVLKIPIHGGSKHPGGAMQFDSYGDLWISTGNDYTNGADFPVWSSANTNDLRGKILRIHPTADGRYTVPDGNLFKAGANLTKPEIYVMGNRNPYTIALDPVRRWLFWGEVGPDNTDMDGKPMNGPGSAEKTEEYNLALAPGNYGYPFFSGDRAMKAGIDPAAPVIPADANWGGITPGMTKLPPAIPAIYSYKKSCAITGPYYRYDPALKSSVKFPPHFDGKWMVSDFNGDNQPIKVFTLDAAGKNVVSEQNLPGIALHGPLDIEAGPDGAIYVNNYGGVWRASEANTGIVRIDYTGTCAVGLSRPVASAAGPRIELAGARVSVRAQGAFTLLVRDIAGRPVLEERGAGPAAFDVGRGLKPGVYLVTARAAEGEATVKLALP